MNTGFLILMALAVCIGLPILSVIVVFRALRRANEAHNRSIELDRRIAVLEGEVRSFKQQGIPAEEEAPEQEPPPFAKAVPLPEPAPPLIPAPPLVEPALVETGAAVESAQPEPAAPPRLPRRAAFAPPRINWEQFMGVKLFAWLGGLALFLGIVFIVKYSFDQGYISPPVRVALGLLVGLGLLGGGLRLQRDRYAVTVQTLCATGVLILYADIFAACSFYHLLPAEAAFVLMILVTATAFLLAVRLDAQAVAVLGLLGGFLTPPLLSTGVDHPLGLFSYVALLDAGLLALALRKRWNYLALLAATATILMQWGWLTRFFAVEKMWTAMAVFLGFAWLFALALVAAHKKDRVDKFISAAAILLPVSALIFAFHLLAIPYPAIAGRPGPFFGFVFLADVALLSLAWYRDELRPVNLGAGAAVFLLLSIWTLRFLTPDLLNWALAAYLVFAMLHSIYPVVLEKRRPIGRPYWWAQLFTPLALVLALLPILKLETISFAVWPVILLMDLLAIALAVIANALMGIIAVLLLTLLTVALWIGKAPAVATVLPGILFVVGGFAVFFFVAGIYAARKIVSRPGAPARGEPSPAAPDAGFMARLGLPSRELFQAQVPALSAILPFLLLIMVVLRLPMANPSPVFALAALLIGLLLWVVRFYQVDMLGVVGLVCVVALEAVWHFHRFTPEQPVPPLLWYIGFYAVFGLFPFLFQGRIDGRMIPWLTSALAGPLQFFFVHRLVKAGFPNSYMGLLPAAFAVPSLLALVRMLKTISVDCGRRNTLLALFGGIGLFFITLIFPIQFDREWITIGWAVEGVALLWLLHRVPHEGLKIVGVGLLCAAFVRLALNPAVFTYHPRTATPILNWYLYAYGIVALCQFSGARLLAQPRRLIRKVNVPPILSAFGTVLAFLLVNIEIADYFSTGTTVTFRFSGNFARDMTYSLAWGVFAFVLLFAGIHRRLPAARYGGLGLLSVTLLKLFLHDLWRLGGLYRIGSFIGLALVLILVSFLYQRFVAADADKEPPKKEDQ